VKPATETAQAASSDHRTNPSRGSRVGLSRQAQRPDYGIDAAGAFRAALIGGAGAVTTGAVVGSVVASGDAADSLRPTLWVGALLLAYAAAHLWSSKVGKRRLASGWWLASPGGVASRCSTWDAAEDSCWWRRQARARRPRRRDRHLGRQDQSNNHPGAPLANAAVEHVTDRVEVFTADARHIPFDDSSFDVVVSSFVLHNLHRREDRRVAPGEIVRVRRPGGRVAIVDIFRTGEYHSGLIALGLREVRRRRVLKQH
jgi:SAM-dependent methyltransferase